MIKSILILCLALFGSSDTFRERLEVYLSQQLKNFDKYEYEIVRGLDKVNDGNEITFGNDIRLNLGYAYIPIVYKNNDGFEGHSYITLKVKLFGKVLVAVKDIERDTKLTSEDFEVRNTEITTLRGKPVEADDGQLNTYRAKLNIKQGDVLTNLMIEKIPVVFVGDKVTVNSIAGNVSVSVDAICRQEGSIDDIIRVETSGRKILKVKVIDKNNVLILE